MANPLIDDSTVDFILHDLLDVDALTRLPRFQVHSPQTLRMSMDVARRLAREVLFPSYRPMDLEPAAYANGRITTHPLMKKIYPQLAEAGLINATRPTEVGGQQLPHTVGMALMAYLNAGNPAVTGFSGLTVGAAHLIETFGSDELKERFMAPMYEGRWTGTMCLTEPHAGSSLADVRSRATPQPEGHYLLQGAKVFISGGDNSFSENIIHLVLARVDGAPPGIKGVSLFAVPRLRPEDGKLVDNDVTAAGTFHKLGWRGLPSIALQLGDNGRCHGYLVGPVNQGLKCMFQMMNEARLLVGLCATATASVAYHEALDYARNRPQGRALTNRDPSSPQIPIIQHADVRRMLLAQKAIVEGCLSLLLSCAHLADLAEASEDAEERTRCQKLLDLLTPIAKSYPSEKGFESNSLAVQVHGGYGYTSEFLPEALLRDQKLNTLHEGTTGIQSLDLLARKIFGDGGQGLALLNEEIQKDVAQAREMPRLARHAEALGASLERWGMTLAVLGARAQGGEIEQALGHSVTHLEVASINVIAWQWLRMGMLAVRAQEQGKAPRSAEFYEGKLRAADYWFSHELPRTAQMCELLQGNDESFLTMPEGAF